jgi:chromosome segregation protein
MKLKKLEILGFKSFKDKIQIDLSDGITTIVGPNGCGKSNIVDAIRWVMGEQRITMLRGKKMDDVIFNGSDGKQALGMAEVSLTLENDGHNIPEKYANYSEIKISRRIYREGENEYSINKIPCRLLDVREFFMDAGVGARTYSIVEQERISKLVEAKPEERRQFIEEAAGIIKYKTRKDSALRKMESTRQNITRLNDITREVKSQMNSISRQAKKAETYKILRKDIKEARLTLALQASSESAEKIDALKASRKALDERATLTDTDLKGFEAQIEEIKARLVEGESTFSSLQEHFFTIKSQLTVKEQEIRFSKKLIEDLEEKKKECLEEIATLREKREETGEERESLKAQLLELGENISTTKNAIGQMQGDVDLLREREEIISREVEEEKTRHIDIIAENARLKNVMSTLERGIEDIRKKTATEGAEIRENNQNLELLMNRLGILKSEISAHEEHKRVLKQREISAISEHESAKVTLADIEKSIEGLKEKIGIKSSRLVSLKDLKKNHEWCNEGTRSILQAKSKPDFPRGEFFGMVADHIDVPREYEVAVEAALGEKLQYIIVKSQKEGIKAIDYLKNSLSGRSSFIPLEMRSAKTNSELPEYLKESVRLIDHVHTTENSYKNVIEYLLRDVLLTPNLTTGMQMWRRNGFAGTYVTPEGDIINPNGILTGGSEVNGGSSLLRNKREIAELEKEIIKLDSGLADKKRERSEAASIISQLDNQISEMRTTIHESELIINGKRKDVERVEGEIKWIGERITVLTYNKENLESEETEALERIRIIKEELAAHEQELANDSNKITALQETWNDVKQRLTKKEGESVEMKILLTSLEEKRNGSARELVSLERATGDIEEKIHFSIEVAENSEKSVGELIEKIESEENGLNALYEKCKEIEGDLSERRESRGKEEIILREKEAEAVKTRKAHENVSKELNRIDLEIAEAHIQTDSLNKDIFEKYNLNLTELLEEFTPLNEYDIEELQTKYEAGKKKLEDFGEVNLLALSEHEELKERFDFLSTQTRDLNSSVDTLQKTITRINQITKKRFSETFDAVNDCFKEVFPRLFPGGRGTLSLTDESDMLETGVDIDINIPGKKRQTLSLLSGGEKALSAVALIFSILLYRPTPFLILDEADAPLDDRNVLLFNNLLKDLSKNSQILSITHNKRTMETANNLIGVTMEENGISTLVSVSLN